MSWNSFHPHCPALLPVQSMICDVYILCMYLQMLRYYEILELSRVHFSLVWLCGWSLNDSIFRNSTLSARKNLHVSWNSSIELDAIGDILLSCNNLPRILKRLMRKGSLEVPFLHRVKCGIATLTSESNVWKQKNSGKKKTCTVTSYTTVYYKCYIYITVRIYFGARFMNV